MPRLEETYLDGAADICIEVVSPNNELAEYVTKKSEYERAGVKEYWVLNPHHREALFYRLGKNRQFIQILPDNGRYTTSLLPKFKLDTHLLWQTPLPNIEETLDLVEAMLA